MPQSRPSTSKSQPATDLPWAVRVARFPAGRLSSPLHLRQICCRFPVETAGGGASEGRVGAERGSGNSCKFPAEAGKRGKARPSRSGRGGQWNRSPARACACRKGSCLAMIKIFDSRAFHGARAAAFALALQDIVSRSRMPVNMEERLTGTLSGRPAFPATPTLLCRRNNRAIQGDSL